MKIDILSEKENRMLKRKEVYVMVDHHGRATPGRGEILKELSAMLKANSDCIVIDKIMSMYGKASSRVKVFVYKKPEDVPLDKREKMERRMKKAKQAGEQKSEGGE